MKGKVITVFICVLEIVCALLLLVESISGDVDTVTHLLKLLVLNNLVLLRVLGRVHDKIACLIDKEG